VPYIYLRIERGERSRRTSSSIVQHEQRDSLASIQYNKIKPVRRRGGGRRGFRPPLILKFRDKTFKKSLKKINFETSLTWPLTMRALIFGLRT
jgi:hypothetical protein